MKDHEHTLTSHQEKVELFCVDPLGSVDELNSHANLYILLVTCARLGYLYLFLACHRHILLVTKASFPSEWSPRGPQVILRSLLSQPSFPFTSRAKEKHVIFFLHCRQRGHTRAIWIGESEIIILVPSVLFPKGQSIDQAGRKFSKSSVTKYTVRGLDHLANLDINL